LRSVIPARTVCHAGSSRLTIRVADDDTDDDDDDDDDDVRVAPLPRDGAGVPYVQESVWVRLMKTLDIMVGRTDQRPFPVELERKSDLKVRIINKYPNKKKYVFIFL
jgi:hypothetical protein